MPSSKTIIGHDFFFQIKCWLAANSENNTYLILLFIVFDTREWPKLYSSQSAKAEQSVVVQLVTHVDPGVLTRKFITSWKGNLEKSPTALEYVDENLVVSHAWVLEQLLVFLAINSKAFLVTSSLQFKMAWGIRFSKCCPL